jgi:hypothetical protein
VGEGSPPVCFVSQPWFVELLLTGQGWIASFLEVVNFNLYELIFKTNLKFHKDQIT